MCATTSNTGLALATAAMVCLMSLNDERSIATHETFALGKSVFRRAQLAVAVAASMLVATTRAPFRSAAEVIWVREVEGGFSGESVQSVWCSSLEDH